jgi:16S rRNA (cytidine1402-2'-O)-methyltransferase
MSEEIQRGALYVVSTPIGNLEDITRRAVTILGGVDVIAAEDTRTTGILLAHLGIRKPLVSYYSRVEERRTPELVRQCAAGKSVAVVTDAGTPGISDPASVVIRAALEAGISVIPVPGPAAFLAALVASGLPMDRFVFEGFLPLKKGRKTKWEQLRGEDRTMVLYESPHRIVETVEEMLRELGDRPVAVARELTKKFEEVFRGNTSAVLDALRNKVPKGEYVIVVAGARHAARNPVSKNSIRT